MPLSAKLVTQNRMNKTPVLGALSTASAARRAEAAALEVRNDMEMSTDSRAHHDEDSCATDGCRVQLRQLFQPWSGMHSVLRWRHLVQPIPKNFSA